MNNGRPLSRKQTAKLLFGLTILAWATQTLLKQWGFGAELPTTTPAVEAQPERFVPSNAFYTAGSTLELRREATVIGGQVKLRQICRWSDRDKQFFEPLGDMVMARLATATPFKSVSVEEIRSILRDAGVNIASINFAGAVNCTVSRTDVEYDEKDALEKWIEARDPIVAREVKPASTAAPATTPAAAPRDEAPVQTLRDALTVDLASRLNIPVETLQFNFKAQDEKVLSISRPLFRFEIEPLRARNLGPVMWNVTIIGNGSAGAVEKRKVTISADARAWQEQIVVSKPLAARQIIRNEDVIQRRALVDQLSDDSLLTIEQSVGQQAARDLKPGTVLTGRLVDPVALVKVGQFVTVSLDQGSVRIKTVVRALEGGSFGQTIRVKNEATRETFQVTITGPQTATMSVAPPIASAEQN
ncbi:MAG TPA: flagellar basal body P-ring formation chaperone FlgA [Tepidisphaeraceae bacterium]|nr:flagellar basal body P-ring formation chaperone FlgA [Tepidisphaeraceae bacterium]